METILPISLKLYFTRNTSGCYELIIIKTNFWIFKSGKWNFYSLFGYEISKNFSCFPKKVPNFQSRFWKLSNLFFENLHEMYLPLNFSTGKWTKMPVNGFENSKIRYKTEEILEETTLWTSFEAYPFSHCLWVRSTRDFELRIVSNCSLTSYSFTYSGCIFEFLIILNDSREVAVVPPLVSFLEEWKITRWCRSVRFLQKSASGVLQVRAPTPRRNGIETSDVYVSTSEKCS